jgi:hypothetical protein
LQSYKTPIQSPHGGALGVACNQPIKESTMTIGMNYTGKIHKTYAVSQNKNGPARADCNQHIVVGSSIDAEKINAANESQFCGRCFRKDARFETRKAQALFFLGR